MNEQLTRDLQTLRDALDEANTSSTSESTPDWQLLRVYMTLCVRAVPLLDSAIAERKK